MTTHNKFSMATAPRCFGKSTLLSTIQHFFMLEENNGVPISKTSIDDDTPITDTPNYLLFTNPPLKISEHEASMRKHFGKHPVIYIDFSSCVGPIKTLEDVKKQASKIIAQVFMHHKYLIESSKLEDEEKETYRKFCDPDNNEKFFKNHYAGSLNNLSCYVRKHFGHRCVLLVDEYDYLCFQSMMNMENADDIKTAIRFYGCIMRSVLKGNHENVEFVFLTGISSIGSTAIENVQYYKFLQNEELTDFYGLTEEEFDCLLRPYVPENILDLAKLYYNGYHEYFGKKVYSLWSALKIIESETKQIDNHWIASGRFLGFEGALKLPAMKLLIEHMLQGNTISIDWSEKLCPDEVVELKKYITNPSFKVSYVDVLLNFYLEQGYLTTVDTVTRMNTCHVGISNKEIESEFFRLIKEYYTTVWGVHYNSVHLCATYLHAMFDDPQKYIKDFCNGLKDICSNVSMEDGHPFNEVAFHHLIYFITLQSDYKCLTETYCSFGERLDLCLIRNHYGIIIDLKMNGTPSDALKHILEGKYQSIFKNVKFVTTVIKRYILLGINITSTTQGDFNLDFCYLLDNEDEQNMIKS